MSQKVLNKVNDDIFSYDTSGGVGIFKMSKFMPTEIHHATGGIGTSGYILTSTGTSGNGWAWSAPSTWSSANLAIGDLSDVNTTSSSLYIGTGTGTNSTGNNNTFIGINSGNSNTSGTNNTFIGIFTGQSNTDGYDNTYVGQNAGYSNFSGHQNTFVGNTAGYNNTSNFNTFVGVNSGVLNTIGDRNTFIGLQAGYDNVSASNNTYVGLNSGFHSTHSNNTFLGASAGFHNRAGTNNVVIGFSAQCQNQNIPPNALNDSDNEIVIGASALGNGSNTITLGNAQHAGLYIPGLQTGAATGDVLTFDGTKIALTAGGGGGTTTAIYANSTISKTGIGPAYTLLNTWSSQVSVGITSGATDLFTTHAPGWYQLSFSLDQRAAGAANIFRYSYIYVLKNNVVIHEIVDNDPMSETEDARTKGGGFLVEMGVNDYLRFATSANSGSYNVAGKASLVKVDTTAPPAPSGSFTGGTGIDVDAFNVISTDSTIVNTTSNQYIDGLKNFSNNVSIGLTAANGHSAWPLRVGGTGIDISGTLWLYAHDAGGWGFHNQYWVSHAPYYIGLFVDHGIRAARMYFMSDRRIKKDIVDIQDDEALRKLRTLKPKRYKYIDPRRGTQEVYGFIAQEVGEVIPYSVKTEKSFLPSHMCFCKITGTYEDTSVLNMNISHDLVVNDVLSFRNNKDILIENVKVIEIIDDKTIKIDKVFTTSETILTAITGETENDMIYLYGKEIPDLHILNKDSIWTTATAALQEVDRQLQAEKIKNLNLTSRLEALEARITSLEAK